MTDNKGFDKHVHFDHFVIYLKSRLILLIITEIAKNLIKNGRILC
jgi:hypothetical protein